MAAKGYEEVAAEHWYPPEPRNFSNILTLAISRREVGVRLMRSILFFTPWSCFTEQKNAARCCASTWNVTADSAPAWCFDEIYIAVHCCGQIRVMHKLDSFLDSSRTWNASSQPTPEGIHVATRSCYPLRHLGSVNLTVWMRAFLALPKKRQAACAAGTLANILSAASPEDVKWALQVLLQSVQNNCPVRRALVTIRRNLMLWRHQVAVEGMRSLSPDLSVLFFHILRELERCHHELPKDQPVMHLHVPKTAGTSLCKWAGLHGLVSTEAPSQYSSQRYKSESIAGCFLDGDGPPAFGEPAVPASCAQRLQEATQLNVSWMSVERWIDLPLCDDFRYVVVLREPVARLLSYFRHYLSYFQEAFTDLGLRETSFLWNFFGKLWRMDEIRSQLPGREETDWLDLWQGMASNYQVRSLAGAGGGQAFLEKNDQAVRRLPAAMATLEQLDVLLVVGKRSFRVWQQELIRRQLGLLQVSSTAFPEHSHDVKRRAHGFMSSQHVWAPGELEETQARNAADTLLLKHARLLQRLDREYYAIVTAAGEDKQV